MKLSSMAKSNLKGNFYRYIMYYLSNSFAVTAFFIFVNFLFHPEVKFNDLGGHAVAAAGAVAAVITCMVIIVAFSVLFVGYATSVFLKSRGKEFGLLSLYGMTKTQIRKYVFMESTIISIISVVTGIIVGGVFSKLFLMAMEEFIGVNLYFNISLQAVLITLVLFFIMFELISFLMLFKINDKEIVEQIKSGSKPKEIPSFSKKKAILGLLLLILGYTLAWFAYDAMVILLMIPVTLIVSTGTYFIFTQFSIYYADRMSKSNKIKYHPTKLISYSQMIYKLQDTAKVLFLSAILGAITFTATETVFSFYTSVAEVQGFDTREDFITLRKGENLKDTESLKNVEKRYEKLGVKVSNELEIPLILGKNLDFNKTESNREEVAVMSVDDYNKHAKVYRYDEITINIGETIYIDRNDAFGTPRDTEKIDFDVEQVTLRFKDFDYSLKKVGERSEENISLRRFGYPDFFVVSKEDFSKIGEAVGEENLAIYSGFNLSSLNKSYDESRDIIDELRANGYDEKVFSKVVPKVESTKSFGMILFIGFFISFLFFIATGSIIYFKLFNEIKQDKQEYDILKKIGIKKKELKKIIGLQLSTIFFLPFIVSTMHSFFALKSLSNLLRMNLIMNGLIVMFGYLVVQVIYYIIIKKIYMGKINEI